ncbi:MAG: hypothetical protein JWN58_1627, partial [Gammaproteobacteria bacterium]|nr:hypothetical protein [Gammaproteobacteria bacterium]
MRQAALVAIILLSLRCAAAGQTVSAASIDPAAAARFAGLALKCLHDEYPSHISLT